VNSCLDNPSPSPKEKEQKPKPKVEDKPKVEPKNAPNDLKSSGDSYIKAQDDWHAFWKKKTEQEETDRQLALKLMKEAGSTLFVCLRSVTNLMNCRSS
jgi:hypothetical protein